MRKGILALVAIVAFAGVASAFPTGPGGTLYFATADPGGQVTIEYVNVNSNWQPCDSNGIAISSGAVVRNSTVQTAGTGAAPYAFGPWINPDDNNQFTESAFAGAPDGGADLYLVSQYNTTATRTSGTGTIAQGYDMLKVSKAGGLNQVTVLNNGVNSNITSTSDSTTECYQSVAVSSNFLPSGDGAAGIQFMGHYSYGVWVDSSGQNGLGQTGGIDGSMTTLLQAGGNLKLSSSSALKLLYSDCGTGLGRPAYTVNGNATTGVTVYGFNSNHTTIDMFYRTPTVTGGYTRVITYNSDILAASTGYTTADATAHFRNMPAPVQNSQFAMGDTNGDGVVDVYYRGSFNDLNRDLLGTSAYDGLGHGRDLNNDGDFGDMVNGQLEATRIQAWAASNNNAPDILLIQATQPGTYDGTYYPGGQWLLLQWFYNNTSNNDTYFNLYPLSADGDSLLASQSLIHAKWNTGGTTLTGDASLLLIGSADGAYNTTKLATAPRWVPLAEQQEPEPATLMLVGTGVLGLAGIIRRRLIS